MLTIKTVFEETTEVNRSKFIAHLVPHHRFEADRRRLHTQHPKASHIVTAFRYLNDYDQVVEAGSDDGEPRGCAGLPVLNVLRGAALIDSAILIVRYFGGIKLGTGGMVRAYTLAAQNVLSGAEMHNYQKMIGKQFTSDYSSVQKLTYLLGQSKITEVQREFLADRVLWDITADQLSLDDFTRRAGRLILDTHTTNKGV